MKRTGVFFCFCYVMLVWAVTGNKTKQNKNGLRSFESGFVSPSYVGSSLQILWVWVCCTKTTKKVMSGCAYPFP
jgi:hypothetical protein